MKKQKQTPTVEETPEVTSEASVQTEKMTLDGIDLSEFTPEASDIAIVSKTKPTIIPIGRRDDQTWQQFHKEWVLRLNCIKRKADRSHFPVTREALPYCLEWVKPYKFFVGITTSNAIFLLDIPEETEDEKDGKALGRSWHESAQQYVIEGRKGWIRVVANRSAGGYDIKYPEGNLGEPVWPDVTLEEILNIAFRDRIIKDKNHRLIKDLQGQKLL